MKNCGNKIKHTCAEKNYATCVYYELEVPSFSSLVDEDCKTLEETTEDQYILIGDIKENISTDNLNTKCIEYEITPQVGITVKSALFQHEEEICNLKTRIEDLETTAICDINITNCGIDLSGINNNCEIEVTTLGELLEYIVNTIQNP